MERSHRREILEQFGEQLLRMALDLLLLGRQLLKLAAGKEDRLEMLQDQVLVIIRRLERLKQVKTLITPEEASQRLHG